MLSLLYLSFLFSYLLNFIWEAFHGIFLYEGMNFNAKKYFFMVSYVSAMDDLLIGIYFLVALFLRDATWVSRMNKKHAMATLTAGLVVAAVIEYRKAVVLKIWSYSRLMPTIFGIGLSPLLQLSVTGLIAFWLTGRLCRGGKGCDQAS